MEVKFSDFKIVPVLDSIRRCDMDDETYFSDKYRQYISNSRLKYINPAEGGNPNDYKNPPHLTTTSLKVGSSVHELLLQPESFKLMPKMGRPSAKLGDVVEKVYLLEKGGMERTDAIRKACVDVGYYVNQIERKIPYIIEKGTPFWEKLDEPREKVKGVEEIWLSDADYDTVTACLNSCYKNDDIMKKLHPETDLGEKIPSYNEIAFFIDFVVTYKDEKCCTLKFKMKADNYTVDVEDQRLVLNDLKTTSKPAAWFMNEEYGSLIHYHYYRQLALYLWILELYASKKHGFSKEAGWTSEANFLVVQTCAEFTSRYCRLNNYWLKKGLQEGQELLKRIAAYKMFGWSSEINFE